MSIIYNIYSNNNLGGAVNFAAPIGSSSTLSFTTATLPVASDTTFIVRAQDTATGLEEANTLVVQRIILDLNGNDVSHRPNPPHALQAAPTPNGGCLVSWAYQPLGEGGAPTGFYVYLTAGASSNYTVSAATVPYFANAQGYTSQLTGLVDTQPYTVAVRAFNAVATEPNTYIASLAGDSTPPSSVELLAVASF